MNTRRILPVLAVLTTLALTSTVATASAAPTTLATVKRGLQGLLKAKGGPPGAIATFYRGGKLTVVSVGRSNVARRGAPRATDHMRIASVAKAFSGAVALKLVQQGRLGLDQTIGQL